MFAAVVASYASDNPIFAYAVRLKDNRFIGSCGISEVSADGVYECYYSLLPNYWGKGMPLKRPKLSYGTVSTIILLMKSGHI